MVLLHRLSALKYRQRYFDFSQNALILTPNEQFSLHIKGLAEGLQIGSVHRISVEQYYLDMLLQYDSAFKPENKIVSEMQVRQDYVDYIYSDQFKNDFERAYNDILEKRNGLVDILIQLQEAMNQEKKTISWTEESRFTIQMKYSVDALNDLLRKKEQDFASAQDKITKAEERRAFLEDRIPASEQFAKSIVQESLPRVNTKIGEYVLEKQQEIEALNKKIQELQEEYARIQGALIIFGKRAKLEKLDADIEEVKAKVIPLQTQLDEQKKILSMRQDGKEDDEILAWMKQVSVYIKKVQDEVRLCSNAKEEYSRFFNELSESDDNIKAAYEGYHRVEAEQYSEEIKKTIQYLYEQLEKYSLVNIYQQIYDESVQVFKEKNGVKSITGKCHRYDLYVQLMFAMKYFNKKIGNMQFICVDEGQDLAVNEYRLLSELNQNHVVFNIFGDTNQLMKSGRGISDWNLLLSELQAEQYVLNENYRNTNQITRFCNDNFGLKTLQTGVDGPKVREISRRDLEKELAGLMITTERIAILLPRTVQKMKYLDMDILPENIRNMIGETMDNGFISVMYVDEVKGIEFDKVFVVSAAMHRNEKYIAYTRALSELIVVQKRFIFIDYQKDTNDCEVSSHSLVINGKLIEMTKIILSDFGILYDALSAKKAALPVKLLRRFKDELYSFALTQQPGPTMQVAALDDGRIDENMLALSIGLASTGVYGLARAVNSEQWYRNIILHDSMYSCDKLLEYVYPELAKQNSWKLPVWYYIANSDYKSSLAESKAPHSYNDIVSEDSIKRNRTAIAGRTAMEIWTQEKTNVFKAIRLLGFLPEDKIDVEQYQQILETIFKENANILSSSNTSDRSSLKRMIRIYDFLLYRQKKTP